MVYFQQLVALRTMSLYSTVQRVLLDVGLRDCDMNLYLQKFLPCRLVPNGIISWGKIPQYKNGEATEDRFDFTASFQKTVRDRLLLSLNLRQPVVTGFTAPFLPYLGADYFLVKSSRTDVILRGNISKNYRVPTLNDRYWQDSGSTLLLPEVSYAAEVGWQWRINQLKIDNSWFVQTIDQWIQWIPQENGQICPEEY